MIELVARPERTESASAGRRTLESRQILRLLTSRLSSTILGSSPEVKGMAQKQILDKLSIYIPQSKITQMPVERLIKLGEKTDRSVNYLVVEAILGYLAREEKKD